MTTLANSRMWPPFAPSFASRCLARCGSTWSKNHGIVRLRSGAATFSQNHHYRHYHHQNSLLPTYGPPVVAARNSVRCFASASLGAKSKPEEATVKAATKLTNDGAVNDDGVEIVLRRATALTEQVLGDNWADYFWLVQNMDFWLAELKRIEDLALPYADSDNPELREKMRFLRRMFDVLCILEDVRDHMNEIMELSSRASGIAGIGLNAGPPVTNLEDHAKAASAIYDRLRKNYPEFSHQIETVLGMALAVMRQKHKFQFSMMHQYFF